MNDRMQLALDGELSREELTPAELAELDESTGLFAGVLGSIPRRPLPDLGPSVLQRIETADTPVISPFASRAANERAPGFVRWLWSPCRISIRPAYALGIAAMLAVAIATVASDRVERESGLPPIAEESTRHEVLVDFRFEAPDAQAVSLAGDFSDWAPSYHMKRTEPGVWTIVVPLEPGMHSYSFIVDGKKWVPDPAAPAVADGFGGMNSRIAVIAPDARKSL